MSGKIFKAEGLILRTRILGEADRLVTLLTREEGKFEAVARGARKTKSKLAAGVDLFAHGHFTFHRGRTWPIITGFDPLLSFEWFRNNPDLYPYGLYLAELSDRFNSGEESCPEAFQMLVDGWTLLGREVDRALLCRAFELKLAACGGYSPQLQCCAICGLTTAPSFSPRQGGLVCPQCVGADAFKVSNGTLALTRRLLEAPLEKVSGLRAGAAQKKELAALTAAFYAYHLDLGELKTRRLLPE